MESSKFMKIMLVVAIVFFLIMVGLGFLKVGTKRNDVLDDPDGILNAQTGTVKEKIEYMELEEISGDYTIEMAIADKCYVVDKMNLSHNELILEDFIAEISNSGDSKLRVVMETPEDLLYFLDIETSGDKFIITQNERQLGGGILKNEYVFSDGFELKKDLTILEDGTQLQNYSLAKRDSDINISLFAFIIETDMVPSENESVVSGEVVENE